ncbi:MAG: hypothetical protein K8T90_01380 [Planctomycetes bacterium]|nr:hypothetical protein [Planctomycetota bacterium]
MAAKEPANPLEKRELLQADKPNPAKIDAVAAAMGAEGRWPEAVDYVEISKNPELLAKAEADAVKRGAAWLLSQADRIRGKASPPETWVRLAESAQAAERWIDAVRALGLAGRETEAEALRQAKCPDYDPFKPLGK